jgi:hypothetical protein
VGRIDVPVDNGVYGFVVDSPFASSIAARISRRGADQAAHPRDGAALSRQKARLPFEQRDEEILHDIFGFVFEAAAEDRPGFGQEPRRRRRAGQKNWLQGRGRSSSPPHAQTAWATYPGRFRKCRGSPDDRGPAKGDGGETPP